MLLSWHRTIRESPTVSMKGICDMLSGRSDWLNRVQHPHTSMTPALDSSGVGWAFTSFPRLFVSKNSALSFVIDTICLFIILIIIRSFSFVAFPSIVFAIFVNRTTSRLLQEFSSFMRKLSSLHYHVDRQALQRISAFFFISNDVFIYRSIRNLIIFCNVSLSILKRIQIAVSLLQP